MIPIPATAHHPTVPPPIVADHWVVDSGEYRPRLMRGLRLHGIGGRVGGDAGNLHHSWLGASLTGTARLQLRTRDGAPLRCEREREAWEAMRVKEADGR